VIAWVEIPLVKWFLPVIMLAAVAPLAYLFFRRAWASLEADAAAMRRELAAAGRVDYRPLLTLTLGVLILAMQEYYGQFKFYGETIAPWLAIKLHAATKPRVAQHLAYFAENYGRAWWAVTRTGGYLLPYLVWRFAFPRDSLRDMGLRVAGLRQHAWLYAFFVVVMVPILLLVARQPDFGSYYPMCATAGRSWLEFGAWEALYVGQFVALEMFFRGWWIRTTRIFGTGSIFCMAVPYCMIHFGKPYLEVCSAIIAGVVLGSLSIQTRSIWAGVMVHVTVAILNDVLALQRKGQLPTELYAGSGRHFTFRHWNLIIGIIWAIAIAILVLKIIRVWPRFRTWRAARRPRPSR